MTVKFVRGYYLLRGFCYTLAPRGMERGTRAHRRRGAFSWRALVTGVAFLPDYCKPDWVALTAQFPL